MNACISPQSPEKSAKKISQQDTRAKNLLTNIWKSLPLLFQRPWRNSSRKRQANQLSIWCFLVRERNQRSCCASTIAAGSSTSPTSFHSNLKEKDNENFVRIPLEVPQSCRPLRRMGSSCSATRAMIGAK